MRYHLALGIDIDMSQLSFDLQNCAKSLGIEKFMTTVGESMIDGVARMPFVKIQSAFFEAQGPQGIQAMKNISVYAQKKGLSVILDAKRGDIASTMRAYGEFAFNYMKADALTVLPYMGAESMVTSLLPWLKDSEKKIYVVLVSSNDDGREIQAGCYQNIFKAFLEAAGKNGVDPLNIGFVVGATRYHEIPSQMQDQLKLHRLLLPGFGAQGATMNSDLVDLKQTGYESLFPISRGLVNFSKVELNGLNLEKVITGLVRNNSVKFQEIL